MRAHSIESNFVLQVPISWGKVLRDRFSSDVYPIGYIDFSESRSSRFLAKSDEKIISFGARPRELTRKGKVIFSCEWLRSHLRIYLNVNLEEALQSGLYEEKVNIECNAEEGKLMKVLAEKTAQVLVSDTITLPVAAVKVSEVVASVRDVNCFVINNKVIFQGTLHKQIFFVDLKGLVRHLGVDVPFSGFVDVPGVQAGAACELFPSVEFLNFSFISPNQIQESTVIAVGVKITNQQAGGLLFTNTLPPTLLRFGEPNTFRVSGNPPGSVASKGGAASFGNVVQAGNVVCPENVSSTGNIVCPFFVSPANTVSAGNVICTGNTVATENVASSGNSVSQGNGHSTGNGTPAGTN